MSTVVTPTAIPVSRRDPAVVHVDAVDAVDAAVRAAEETGARAILIERAPQEAAASDPSSGMARRVLAAADVPAVTVGRHATGLPRRVIVATDFSPHSLHAARVALDFVAADATVIIAHVRPHIAAAGPTRDHWDHTYERVLPTMFAGLRAELAAPRGVRIETVSLDGGPAGRRLIELAAATGADLIVSGTHGHGGGARLALGDVAAALLRGAPCSTLLVPGAACVRHHFVPNCPE